MKLISEEIHLGSRRLTDDATNHKPTTPAIVVLTPSEAAEALKISSSWLAKARMRGDGPAYLRIGRSVRYREEDLIAWLEAQRKSLSG